MHLDTEAGLERSAGLHGLFNGVMSKPGHSLIQTASAPPPPPPPPKKKQLQT